ncbi:unnamed protein product [Zymoseptoria tritici ST99CH_1A5]|uniref:Uncharacterized protein n=3 Tax=Zymoseptoria tritici TaxID=1047171 RepID=A0A1X7RP34_ZYMT9|nr:unnamed protein product [Zymoseptoria tritici ST99CH_3D7]SMR48793.1 unnamed protein product [Zymoseptoria tritici ST99CH_1E4]SMR49978.1 unnamed protein product [Zymoseptoria tritici ST99CH_3D1]SMY22679.1 unnamed protein product [Zymoseptoria tritici ST99CH_1A5]
MNVQRTARLLSSRARLLQRPTRATYSSQSPAIESTSQPSSTQLQQSRPTSEPQYIHVPRPEPKEEQPVDGVFWTGLLLILITPPMSWYYYQHRKEHMGKKKEELIKLMEEKRAALNKELGK